MFKVFNSITRGSKVVTCIQEKARKIVFPIATFLRCEKMGWEILGAEYKKVTKAVIPSQNQCSIKSNVKMPEPISPIMNKKK
jgi:hypothetical protein